jgi:hypothetical protein
MSLSEPGHRQLAFESTCESVQRCLEIGDLLMTTIFLEFAETLCTERQDFLTLHTLLGQVIDIYSTSSSAQVQEQLNLLVEELSRVRLKTSLLSTLVRKFQESWKSFVSKIKISPPKISP